MLQIRLKSCFYVAIRIFYFAFFFYLFGEFLSIASLIEGNGRILEVINRTISERSFWNMENCTILYTS